VTLKWSYPSLGFLWEWTVSCIDIKRGGLLKTIFFKIKILEPYLKKIFQKKACDLNVCSILGVSSGPWLCKRLINQLIRISFNAAMNRKAHINFITEAGIWTRIYSLPRYKKYTASNIESISGTAISLRIRKYTFSGFNEYLVSEVLILTECYWTDCVSQKLLTNQSLTESFSFKYRAFKSSLKPFLLLSRLMTRTTDEIITPIMLKPIPDIAAILMLL